MLVSDKKRPPFKSLFCLSLRTSCLLFGIVEIVVTMNYLVLLTMAEDDGKYDVNVSLPIWTSGLARRRLQRKISVRNSRHTSFTSIFRGWWCPTSWCWSGSWGTGGCTSSLSWSSSRSTQSFTRCWASATQRSWTSTFTSSSSGSFRPPKSCCGASSFHSSGPFCGISPCSGSSTTWGSPSRGRPCLLLSLATTATTTTFEFFAGKLKPQCFSVLFTKPLLLNDLQLMKIQHLTL